MIRYQLLCNVKLVDGTKYCKHVIITEAELLAILAEFNWINVRVHKID